MHRIIPTLWFDGRVEEAAAFYVETFGGKHLRTDYYTNVGKEQHGHEAGDVLTVDIEIDGTRIMLLNGGPYFTLNPAISIFITRPDSASVEAICAKLLEGGKALMPVDTYPFAERYGWIEDKYGMTWQVGVGEPSPATPSLLFTQDKAGKAEEAMNYYASVFPDSNVGMLARYEAGQEPDVPGTIMYGELTLLGERLNAMDSAQDHKFVFSGAVSLQVICEDQAEIDAYWDKLSVVPEAEQCGWLQDQFGVTWQIVPRFLDEVTQNGTPEQIERVTESFMQMKKFDLAELERVYNAS